MCLHLSIYIGCEWNYAIDGNWKICFPHCMFPVHTALPGVPGLNLPNVCPEQPHGRTVFCPSHLELAKERGYKTDLRGFVAQCGASSVAGEQPTISNAVSQHSYCSFTCIQLKMHGSLHMHRMPAWFTRASGHWSAGRWQTGDSTIKNSGSSFSWSSDKATRYYIYLIHLSCMYMQQH